MHVPLNGDVSRVKYFNPCITGVAHSEPHSFTERVGTFFLFRSSSLSPHPAVGSNGNANCATAFTDLSDARAGTAL